MADTPDMRAEQLKRMVKAGLSQRAMARGLGLSQTGVRRYLQVLGLVRAFPSKTAACQNCQRAFVPGRSSYGLFCSNACQQTRAIEIQYDRWLGGDPAAISGPLALRRAVIRRDGYICAQCRGTIWQGLPIPLELEHRDGDSENNRPENLCMLRPNCHAQTPTYKIKNKGRGRHKRRQRYAAGQSH